jgi:hypothetical protein
MNSNSTGRRIERPSALLKRTTMRGFCPVRHWVTYSVGTVNVPDVSLLTMALPANRQAIAVIAIAKKTSWGHVVGDGVLHGVIHSRVTPERSCPRVHVTDKLAEPVLMSLGRQG